MVIFARIVSSAFAILGVCGPALAGPNFDLRHTTGGSTSHTVTDFNIHREESGYTKTFEVKAFSDQAGQMNYSADTSGGGINMQVTGWQGTAREIDPINVVLGSESFVEYTQSETATGTTVTESWGGYTGFTGDFNGLN